MNVKIKIVASQFKNTNMVLFVNRKNNKRSESILSIVVRFAEIS